MGNTMKKVLFFALVFGLLMGGCSITIPGLLTVDYPGGTTSEGGDTTSAQGPLDGVWDKVNGFGPPVVTISGTNAVLIAPLTFAETGNVSGSWAPRYNEAVSRGMIKVGDTFLRNIQSIGTDSRGNTTWSCESLFLTGSGNNARLEWRNGTITMQANGNTELPWWGIYRKR